MTPEERRDLRAVIRRELAELDRPRRDRQLRQGRVKPRNAREWSIFAVDLLRRSNDGGTA